MQGATRIDRTLRLAIFALVCAGLIMVYSSSYISAQERYKDGFYFFKRHLLFCGIGIITFIMGRYFPLERLKNSRYFYKLIALSLAASAIALILTFIPGISHRVGGARRWVQFFFISFQPSEITKLTVIFFVAGQLHKKMFHPRIEKENWRSDFLTYFIGTLPIYFLLLLQPDFGTVVLCVLTTLCMLIACGVSLRYIWTSILCIIPTVSALIFFSPYRRSRLLGFLDPWSDPSHKGFQIIQSFLAFFSGKWFGVGIGNSRAKLFYLPEAHNDFIFSVIGEELGLLGVSFFIGFFLLIILQGLDVGKRLKEKDRIFECALATGISSMIGLQALLNMSVVLGLLPTKGFPLPLISYGGTSLVVVLFMLGILTRLSEKTT